MPLRSRSHEVKTNESNSDRRPFASRRPATRASARAAQAKLAKSAVQYVDAGKDEGKDCDDCAQFVPGKSATDNGTCKIVEGVINPHGHCIAFTPKPKK
jgi:High potential iron-sulfur protein